MIRWLQHIGRILATGSAFLYFFVGGTLFAMLVLPIVRLKAGTPEEKAERCRQWVADAWVFFHDYMRVLHLINYDPRRIPMPLPDGPVVVVANHPTLVDVTAIMSAWPRLVCVAKTPMFKSPLLGRLLRYCDYIEGGDGGLFSAATVVTNAVEALGRGRAILLFPEGTRSPERGLRKFYPGAWEMAARANAPILPLFLTCDPPTLMRGQAWYEVPERMADLSVTVLPMIRPPFADPVEAAAQMQREYQQRLDAFLGQRASPAPAPVAQQAPAQAGQARKERHGP
jgi:1-acyl-sn-glycerol-3-phosphate acyltransferase